MNLYSALNNYVEGKLDINTFNKISNKILQITKDNPNKQKSLVVFKFDSDRYYKLFINNTINDNSHLLNIALNRGYYHDKVFYDDYTATDDFKEGYVFHYFNDESVKILNNILSYIQPNLTFNNINDLDWDSLSKIAKTLIKFFDDEMDEISYYYASFYDDALVEGMRDYVKGRLCNQFEDFGIYEKKCSEIYFSTVGNIINQWNIIGLSEDSDIFDFFELLIEKRGLDFDEDLWEDYHSYFSSENFDLEEFNRDVSRILTKVLDKLEDNMDENTLKERIKIMDFFTKNNIDFDRTTRFPHSKFLGNDNKRRSFIVNNVDDGKINLTDFSNFGATDMKMSLEDFKNYYFHPELF